MADGVTDRLWEVSDLVVAWEAEESSTERTAWPHSTYNANSARGARCIMRRLFRRRRDIKDNSISDDAISPGQSDHRVSTGALEVLAEACGFVVIVGVWLEYGSKLVILIQHPTWTLLKELAGPILIAFGIFGEIFFEHLATSRKDLEIGRLRLLTEQERTKRLEIERSISQRGFTPDQISLLNEHVGRFAGDLTRVFIVFTVEEPEAVRFAVSINTALLNAELNSLLIGPAVPPANFVLEGVLITTTPSEQCQALSKALWDGMRAAGVYAHWGPFDGNAVWMSRRELYDVKEAVVITVMRQPVPKL